MNIQLIVVLVILGLALAFMARKFIRTIGKKGCCEDCSSCRHAAENGKICKKYPSEIQLKK